MKKLGYRHSLSMEFTKLKEYTTTTAGGYVLYYSENHVRIKTQIIGYILSWRRASQERERDNPPLSIWGTITDKVGILGFSAILLNRICVIF